MLPLIQLTNIYKVPPPKKIGFNNQNRCDFHCLQEKESSGTHLLWVSFTDRILIVVLPMQIFFKVSKTGLSLTIFQKTYGVLQIKFISAIYDLRRNFRWMTKKFLPPENLTLNYPGFEMVLVIRGGVIMTPPGISQNEATEACEGSNQGFLSMPSSSTECPKKKFGLSPFLSL